MGLSGKKIFIDPGHGGTAAQGRLRCGSYNVGTSGTLSGNEKDSVLTIGIELKGILESYGAIVNISRTTDTALCLGERAELANTWGPTGVRYQDLQVLRDTQMPAILLELGFMSNAGDDAFIAEYEGKLDFINGIVMGLQDYFI